MPDGNYRFGYGWLENKNQNLTISNETKFIPDRSNLVVQDGTNYQLNNFQPQSQNGIVDFIKNNQLLVYLLIAVITIVTIVLLFRKY